MMIAALIAGTVFAADFAASAQDSTNTPPAGARPPGGPRGRFDMIATQLALTDDQKAKAKPIFDEMSQKMADLRKDTTVQGQDRRAKAKEIRDDATTKLKDVLTPEQFAKWEKMAQGNRRPPGGPGAPPAATPPAAPPPATTPPATPPQQ